MTFSKIPHPFWVAPFIIAASVAGVGFCANPQKTDVPAAANPLPLGKFTNPLSPSSADPWIAYRDGFYYMTSTRGWGVAVRRSPTLAGLREAKDTPVWHGGGTGYESYTRDVWAPELHFVSGKWYVYYTATDGPDANRRVFVLQAVTNDPQGRYVFKGKLAVPDKSDDAYAIDGTVWQRPKDGALFALWSGREKETGGAQNIYIAPMSNPWTISGARVRLSSPTLAWEKHGWQVNEGPEVLTRNGKTFVVYSGSGGTTKNYALGLLTNTNGDLLSASSWSKSQTPVFSTYSGPDGHVIAPGHNGFFLSPDGRETWIIYHGKEEDNNTWGGRDARAQKMNWLPDGTPDFGHPIPAGVVLDVPSGEAAKTKAAPQASRK